MIDEVPDHSRRNALAPQLGMPVLRFLSGADFVYREADRIELYAGLRKGDERRVSYFAWRKMSKTVDCPNTRRKAATALGE
jgi:hypothetical protein